MKITKVHCRWAVALWVVGAVAGFAFPSTAQAGFFDFLFGAQPQTQVFRPYDAFPGRVRRHADRSFHRHEHRFAAHQFVAHRKIVLADKTDHPTRPQEQTDIMDDDSLRRGDAVMTQAGIRVFVGYSSDHHRPEDFQKISEIKKLSQRARSALAALDAPRPKPSGQTAGEHGVVTGRSATENENKVSVGETITDPNGRTIRYVGP
jgi:hypothetical protein